MMYIFIISNLRVKMAGFCVHALRGTVHRKVGPDMAEINSPGGPLSAGDQIFRDTTLDIEFIMYGVTKVCQVQSWVLLLLLTLITNRPSLLHRRFAWALLNVTWNLIVSQTKGW